MSRGVPARSGPLFATLRRFATAAVAIPLPSGLLVECPYAQAALASAYLELPDEGDVGRSVGEQLAGRFREVDLVIRSLRHGLEPRGGVGGVPECRVLEPLRRADVPRHDRAGVQADAHPELLLDALRAEPRIEAWKSLGQHLARRRDRPGSVVRLLDRGAEESHDPVAHVRDERPAVGEDRLR